MTKKVEYLEIRVRQLQETINVSNAAKAGLMRERDAALAREEKLLHAMQKVKFLAVTAGAPDEMTVPAALARMVRIAIDVGITEQLPELRTAVTP